MPVCSHWQNSGEKALAFAMIRPPGPAGVHGDVPEQFTEQELPYYVLYIRGQRDITRPNGNVVLMRQRDPDCTRFPNFQLFFKPNNSIYYQKQVGERKRRLAVRYNPSLSMENAMNVFNSRPNQPQN